MKNTLLLLVAIAASLFSFSQEKVLKAELIGEWKPVQVSMDKGAISFDYQTNKLIVADSIRKTWASADDSAQLVEFLSIMFDEMGKMTMDFRANDVYVESRPSGKVKQGTFSFDANSSVLITNNGHKQNFSVKKKGSFLVLETDLDELKKLELIIQKN